MAKAGYCTQCGANVYLNDDYSCQMGHPASCVSRVYEVPGAPAPPPAQATSQKLIVTIMVIVMIPVMLLVCGILAAIAIPVFNAAGGSARRSACRANLRTLDGAMQMWKASAPENVAADIDDLGSARSALSGYVSVDWDKTTRCPADDSPYTVSDGVFACPNAGRLRHTYP